MTRLLVQSYLADGGTYESLITDHAVKAKPHNGKVSFVYDQIAARNDDPVACQCRGLVLREHTWEVVAYPFNRFFNHGQAEASPIDWATARFEEKLDGTLLIVYWDAHDSRWRCATRSMCEAHGDINGAGTFAELADKAAREAGSSCLHSLMEGRGANRRHTHMFELTGPYNTIVCRYDSLKLTLLGLRDLDTFAELDPKQHADRLGFASPQEWHFSNIEHLSEVIREWDPMQFEGVIVKDAAFNRIKVKSPKYLAVAHASDSLGASWRSVVEAVANGATDDVGAMLPPLVRERVDLVTDALTRIKQETERDYAEIRDTDDMKSFAFQAQTKIWPAALFSLKRGKAADLDEVIKNSSADHLLSVCEKVSPAIREKP